jgi:hypothetical protein
MNSTPIRVEQTHNHARCPAVYLNESSELSLYRRLVGEAAGLCGQRC